MNKDIITKEYIHKIRDHKFYLENFCKIKTKKVGAGLQPFILNEAQKDLFNTIRKNNRVIILKARQLGFCLDKDTKILSDDLNWIRLDDVKIGQKIVSVDEYPEKGRGKGRKMRTAVVEKKSIVYEEAFEIKLSNGEKVIATEKHKFLSKKWECSTETCWKRVEDMNVGSSIRYITNTWEGKNYEDGWFSGMIDGEGSLAKKSRSGGLIVVSQVAGPVWNRLIKYLNYENYNYRIEEDKRTPEDSSRLGSKIVYKAIVSRMNEMFRLVGKTRPSRFINNKWWENKNLPGKRSGDAWLKIISIKSVGKREMVDLQTSEKTYIANGLVSHNSTAMTGFFYVDTIMNPGTTTALVGYNSEMCIELLDKIKTFWKTTPPEIRPTVSYNSKYEMSFPKLDSKIIVLPNSDDVGRGYTIHNCLITELSSWDKADTKMEGLEESVPKGGRIVIESTPRGQGNLYHRLWMTGRDESEADPTGLKYVKKEYGWWWGYNREDMEVKKQIKGLSSWLQEYALEFLSTGRPVFPIETIRKHRKNLLVENDIIDLRTDEIYKRNEMDTNRFNDLSKREGYHVVRKEEGWLIYKPVKPGGMYVCGGDVAEGVTGGDYSVATMFDRNTGEEVAMYRGHISPDRFGELLDKWGRKYNNALMAVEVNNHGLTTLTILKQKIYPTLYFRPSKFETLASGQTDRMGWKTTKVTRPLLIDEFEQAAREGVITIRSKKLLDEMSVFIYDDNGNSAPSEGFNDDTIFSAAIGLQAFKLMYSGTLDQINEEQHLPSGGY